ncbi:hypothetical protein NDU88_002523 [Pleurodeles waltl]|uniref:Uncharacterized protein n=1 Tax=Pleurodeles waltl TaxID=8319 RepID=A0AAV7SAN0_PLEWA|nr:hypothetical protein NDU88_002523 [Pleurodeles waltl]
MSRTNPTENKETPKRTKAADVRRRQQQRRRRKTEGGSREHSCGPRIRKSEMEPTRRSRPRSRRSMAPPGTSHEPGGGREGK